jgi:hypothetical protein
MRPAVLDTAGRFVIAYFFSAFFASTVRRYR